MSDPFPCTIRPAVPADVPAIHTLIQGLAEYERMTDDMVATDAQLAAALFPPDGRTALVHAVVAETAHVAVGFALYFFTYSTFVGRPGLYLEDLFVQPAHRGRGIGTALLTHLAREANARGCGRMEWSVLDWNADAIRVYEAFGARRLTTWQICRLDGAALARYR